MWLNEWFATYATLLGGPPVGIEPVGIEPDGSRPPVSFTPSPTFSAVGAPTAATMFGPDSYDGGSLVLTALRQTIGDDEFFELLQRWVADNNGTSRTTDGFMFEPNRRRTRRAGSVTT